MRLAIGIVGVLLVIAVLWDTFETIVLPRSVTRRVRLTRLFYTTFWRFYSGTACRLFKAERRANLMNAFGPLSLLLLISLWATLLITGFALIQFGAGTMVMDQGATREAGLSTEIYLSGSTFFTLGYGDVTPVTPFTRAFAVLEAGVGLGFLAIVIGYVPVIYQSFSRREVGISLLDARAGSPPTGAELLRRYGETGTPDGLTDILRSMESWCADLLESHLSYPVLAYYRSQHDRESWLASLSAVLDACALLQAGFCPKSDNHRALRWQAHLTFAMARHTVVDLALVFGYSPAMDGCSRVDDQTFARMSQALQHAGYACDLGTEEALKALRKQYEPYLWGLAKRLQQDLPPIYNPETAADNWESTAWDNQHL
jgi:Ion channel